MHQSTPPRVFLSYAREDVGAARALRHDLEALSLDVWFDETSLLPGQKWRKGITKAIRNAQFFAILLSRHSVTKRGTVQREVREAIDLMQELPEDAIFLIPVRLEDVKPIHDALNDIQWVDLFPDWSEGIRRISLTIYSQPRATHAVKLMDAAIILGIIARAAERSGADVHYRLQPGFERSSIVASEIPLFTIFTELLSNTVVHGKRDDPSLVPVEVLLTLANDMLNIQITNRVGSDLAHGLVTKPPAGTGLMLTQRAVLQLGGKLEFTLQGDAPSAAKFVAAVKLPARSHAG